MKRLFCFLLVIVLTLSVLSLGAAESEGDFEIEDGVLKKYNGPGGDVVVPDGVTEIAEWAFECCNATSVTFPSSLKKLDKWCFFQCESLADVTIPASVTEIGTQAFAYNWSLTGFKVASGNASFTAVDGVIFTKDKKTLVQYPAGKNPGGNYAVPSGTAAIRHDAFSGAKFDTLTIPASVSEVDTSCCGLEALKAIKVESGNKTYKSVNGVLYEGETLVVYPSTKPNTALSASDFPSGITRLDDYSFQSLKVLKAIEIPRGVNHIGFMCFSFCEALETVTVPASTEMIREMAFVDCPNLKKVTILNPYATIQDSILSGCPNAVLYGYTGSTAQEYAEKTGAQFVSIDKIPTKVTLDSVKFSKKKAAVKEEITITAVTSTNATKLIMYNGSKEIQSWTEGYTEKDGVRTWKVTCTFAKAGARTLGFKAADKKGKLSDEKTANITITKAATVLTLDSVKFAKKQATAKQKVTINAVTSTTATKLIMYSGSKEIQSWTKGYTDKDGKRTWKVTCTFAKAGARTMSFKAADKNGKLTAAKTAKITITEAPTLSKVAFSTDKAKRKETITVTAVTSTNVTKLTMYVGDKAVTTWTEGYKDKNGKRIWTVTCSFASAGERTVGFKGFDANGAGTAKKTVGIEITK